MTKGCYCSVTGAISWVAAILLIAHVSAPAAIAKTLPEYSAAEAKKHIGEKATVIGKLDCIEHGGTHTDLEMGACLPNTLLMVVVPNDLAGLKFDVGQLRGATIAVTGKIESSGGMAQIMIESATQIVPRTPAGPDYLSTAMEKQSGGDLDGAIADLDRAIEQAHEPGMYVQRAEAKMMKGDLDGAIQDYDELIARHPSGLGAFYLSRARLKFKKADYDGAIADCKAAIKGMPEQRDKMMRDQAYELLKRAQAEAHPKHEQSFNKDEVSPESIATVFVQAYSGADVDAVAGLYADRVDYTNSGVISNAAVRAQAREYFARWPARQWSLVGPTKTISLGATKQKVIFSANYDASDPQTNKHVSGIAQETLILASDKSGAIKIVSQKEQTSKRGISQTDGETSGDLGFDVAKTEYGQQTGFACKLVARGTELPLPGCAQRHLENGVEILQGNDIVGERWAAALGPDGKLLCAAKVQNESIGSYYWNGLALEGDHLWLAGVLNNRVFQLGKFNARTLQREASVQTDFPARSDFHWQSEADFEISAHTATDDSIRLVLFSRDLRPLLDKKYSIPDRLGGRTSEPFGDTQLFRLPDRSGYSLVVQPKVSKGKRGPRVGIIRLDNAGTVNWANAYATGYTDSDIQARVAGDGAILLTVDSAQEAARSTTLTKISRDGAVKWSTTVEGIDISFDDDSQYGSPAPYRFTEPSLLAVGTERADLDQYWWLRRSYSTLFAINYQTGEIEKQIKFGPNAPGNCRFVERDANSFYVGFGNMQWLHKPSGHSGSGPNKAKCYGAALRFDYDFNLLAARKIRDAGPILVFFHLFAADRGVISYPDEGKGALMVETTNANFESSTGCQWLEKANFTFTASNFQQHPAHVDSSPLTVTVSDANSKISQADLALAPLDLKAVPCRAEHK
jgi:tetratricopeptide (TPR) repeat protein